MVSHETSRVSHSMAAVCAALLVVAALPAFSAEVEEQLTPSAVVWTAPFEYQSATIAVSGPAGVTSWTVPAGEPLLVETAALTAWASLRSVPVDGAYSYEVRFAPKLDAAARAVLERQRADAGGAEAAVAAVAAMPVASGHFRLEGGAIVGAGEDAAEEGAAKDQVVSDDQIVIGSLCVGMDCVNGESFGFDTIRLKENNLRIKFQDTSNSASFPSTDWQIIANDSTNGGASYLAFEDVDAGRKPFVVEAGARNNALVVDNSGRVGFGTLTPSEELHMAFGDTPGVRLDQDGTAGWTRQIWDVAGNEANFFVRDVTNGSRLPLRIQPGAPTSALTLRADGNVGIGTWAPTAPLEIETTARDATLLLDRTDGGSWYLAATADGSFTLGASADRWRRAADPRRGRQPDHQRHRQRHLGPRREARLHAGRPPRVLDAVARLPITEWSLVRTPAARATSGPPPRTSAPHSASGPTNATSRCRTSAGWRWPRSRPCSASSRRATGRSRTSAVACRSSRRWSGACSSAPGRAQPPPREDGGGLSAQAAAAQDVLVLGGVGVVLGAHRGPADGAAILVLGAGGEHQQEVAPHRPRGLAGGAEELRRLERLVVASFLHGKILVIDVTHVKGTRAGSTRGEQPPQRAGCCGVTLRGPRSGGRRGTRRPPSAAGTSRSKTSRAV
jgi:hypothetical protein